MRGEKKVFQLFGETSASIYPLARDVMRPLFEEYFSEQRFYQAIFFAYNLSPDPITPELFLKRIPYAKPESVLEILEDAVEAGYLARDGQGGYLPAEKGSSAIEVVHDAFYTRANQINEFPDEKSKELASLLAKLVDSVDQSELAGGKICYIASHGGHIQVEPGTLAQVDQLLDDLNAFRDDAHIAAWTPVGVDGHTWEVLTLVWNGNATTAEALNERLPYRQYTVEDYKGSLEGLVQRGWIEEGAEGYLVTDAGKKIRDEAEAVTNENYFRPWKVLTDSELTRLGDLLEELKETNLKMVEKDD
ncbi:MAG: hypothetical protein KAH12_01975 [Anaerolineales bacterium]|nr:hypothetical protein [Anaerolineales bacterium]